MTYSYWMLAKLSLALLAALAVFFPIWLVRRAAHRFAARQRTLGRWDEEGPLVETEPPPPYVDGGNPLPNGRIAGQRPGSIIKDRRKPAP